MRSPSERAGPRLGRRFRNPMRREAVAMKLIESWRRSNRTCIAAVVVAFVVAASAANAESRRVQVGTLTCSLSASIGLIVGSQRNVSCLFRGAPGEPDEPYTGTMTRVGLDVGLTTGSVIIWTVFADTSRHKGMLTGTYTGASAEMSIAAGLGANVLVGGSHQTLALQPVSVQGQIGLDIAAGIGSMATGRTWQLDFQPVQKIPIIHASSGFIWGIPVQLAKSADADYLPGWCGPVPEE
jgi:Protein of unknown function (DUF992)